MFARLVAGFLTIALVGACAEDNRPPPADTSKDNDPVCDGPSAKQPRAAITNGVPGPAISLAAGQQLAVGAILMGYQGQFSNGCTATLVAPKVVLTAAHCVWGRRSPVSPSSLRFAIGTDMVSPDEVFEIEEIFVQSQYATSRDSARYDVAILKLTEDATARVSGLTPIPANRELLGQDVVGATVQVVGYGATSPRGGSNTRKWWTTEELVQVTSDDLVVDGKGQSAVCFGDSGGPMLHTFPNGQVRVIGVVSYGDPSCVDVDHFARVDKNIAWMEQESVAGELPQDGCGGLDAVGTCDGTMLRWCEDGTLRVADCAGLGMICGDDGAQKACLPDPCEGADFTGYCDGDTAVWCDNGVLNRFDCGACGWGCDYISESMGRFCVPK